MLGYILAILAGLSLGLLGGGGSILTVPILVYVFHIDSKVSVAMSLAIVGFSSLIGVATHYRASNIVFSKAFLFGAPAIIGTVLGTFLSQYISGELQLIIFSVIMISASFLMLKSPQNEGGTSKKSHLSFILISGLLVGVITGLIGVGGGFLVVPSLMHFANLDIKKSIGTSLFIISFNSIVGFASYLSLVNMPWEILITFSLCSATGVIIGSKLVNHIPQSLLKKIFAAFLIIIGFYILYKNTLAL